MLAVVTIPKHIDFISNSVEYLYFTAYLSIYEPVRVGEPFHLLLFIFIARKIDMTNTHCKTVCQSVIR